MTKMNEPYHKYVFNNGSAVLQFEKMYEAEDDEGFDAWRQNDPRQLRHRIVTEILKDHNFDSVIDLGCGKGLTSALLKKKNNSVLGVDVSETALRKARASYPDIVFSSKIIWRIVDLVSIQGTMAYVAEWREWLENAAIYGKYCVVCEYIPHNAIGNIKSGSELIVEFERWFVVLTKIVLNDEIVILFGESK